VYIGVADVEAYNTRNTDMKELRKTAIEEYITNYMALGLSSDNCEIYFQSARSADPTKANSYYTLANMVARHTTFNEVRAIYGDISPAKLTSALLQVSDMIHPQLPEFEGPCATVIPVGSDQDPHIKLARDILQRFKLYPMQEISATYHLFLPGLQGGKMSSSIPESFIALTDTPDAVEKKIKKYAFSGGQATVEEHRRLGGNPEIDVPFQWLKMLFEPDDAKLKQIHDDYKSGKMLTGEIKMLLIEKINLFLKEHREKRKKAEKEIDKFMCSGKLAKEMWGRSYE
jgi:tryptophanyl-tRNA synthetase